MAHKRKSKDKAKAEDKEKSRSKAKTEDKAQAKSKAKARNKPSAKSKVKAESKGKGKTKARDSKSRGKGKANPKAKLESKAGKSKTAKTKGAPKVASHLGGRVAVVTGSTSGIGLGIAKKLAAAGCHVVLNGLGDAAEIEKLRKQLADSSGRKIRYHAADMTKPAEVADLVAFAKNELGAVDILVNNAGIQHTAPVEDFPAEKWDAIIAINLSSAFHAISAAIPHMQKAKFGRIINIASVHGLVASTNKAAYVAAKHGLIGLTKVVALENADKGITVNAVCPGWVRTPLVEKQISDLAAKEKLTQEKAAIKLLSAKQPSGRFVEVDELAELVLFLASPAAAGMTGSAVTADGGWTAQ